MRIPLTVIMVCVAGCAAQPHSASPPPASAAVVAPPPAVAGTGAAAVAPGDVNAEQFNDVVKKALKSGYYVSKKNGGKTYCRETTTVGSRFADTVCYTPEQLTEVFARQEQQQELLQQGNVCAGGGACGGSH